jgi:hypothetical protein
MPSNNRGDNTPPINAQDYERHPCTDAENARFEVRDADMERS